MADGRYKREVEVDLLADLLMEEDDDGNISAEHVHDLLHQKVREQQEEDMED